MTKHYAKENSLGHTSLSDASSDARDAKKGDPSTGASSFGVLQEGLA